MEGAWWFDIVEVTIMNLDLVDYQRKIVEIRDAFETKFRSRMNNNELNIEVYWTEAVNPVDNVFARFNYSCTTPNCAKHSLNGKPVWIIYWNPKIVPKQNRQSDVNAKCAPKDFTTHSIRIQQLIVDDFSSGFSLYLENGIDGCDLNRANEYYMARIGFRPTSSSQGALAMLRHQNREFASNRQLTQNQSQEQDPAVTGNSSVPSGTESSSSSSTSQERKRKTFAEYILAEMQDLTGDEQDKFKFSTFNILCEIKRARGSN